MPGSRSGFTLAGIPVSVQPAFFVIIALLGVVSYPMPYPLTWIVIATVSVVVHELGHAVAFRAFGLRPAITLHGMGGLTSADIGDVGAPPFTPVRSIVTSLAGPLAALALLGLPAWIAAHSQGVDPLYTLSSDWVPSSELEVLIAQAVFINIGWSVLNLIPVLPLDGGNVTASVLELFSPRNGRQIANIVSIAAAGALALWSLSNGFLFLLVMAALFVGVNASELASRGQVAIDEQLVDATRALVSFDPARAEQVTRQLLTGSLPADRRRMAVELFAWSRLAQGDPTGAAQAMFSLPPGELANVTLRAAHSLALGRIDEGVGMMAWALVHDNDRNAKVLGAIAVAQAGQVEAVTRELIQIGPGGRVAAAELAEDLERSGHKADASRVTGLLAD